jgi:hypothetical protein
MKPHTRPPASPKTRPGSGVGWVRFVLVLATWATFTSGSAPAQADELDIRVSGLKDSLRASVVNRVETFRVNDKTRLTPLRLQRIVERAEREAVKALRPHGYYHADVSSELTATGEAPQ